MENTMQSEVEYDRKAALAKLKSFEKKPKPLHLKAFIRSAKKDCPESPTYPTQIRTFYPVGDGYWVATDHEIGIEALHLPCMPEHLAVCLNYATNRMEIWDIIKSHNTVGLQSPIAVGTIPKRFIFKDNLEVFTRNITRCGKLHVRIMRLLKELDLLF
jgi:hypothetical protein